MQHPQPDGLVDPQKGLPEPDKTGEGQVALGTDGEKPTASEGDSPNHGSVDGPLAPEPRPGGVEAEGDSEMRPRESGPRRLDGVETFKRMESDAERHQRQSD